MKNKELEDILKSIGCLECIQLIEVCETDKNIKEIEVDKITGFTHSGVINNCIELYLTEMNIKVRYVNMKDRLKETDSGLDSKPEKIKCLNVVHAPFKRPMSKQKKIEMYNNYKMSLFSLDKDTFVVCPKCSDFIKL